MNQDKYGEWSPVKPGMKNTDIAYEITIDNTCGIILTNVVIELSIQSILH